MASSSLLTSPIRVAANDIRVQIPLLLAALYYPDRLISVLPNKLSTLITSKWFLRGLKSLAAFNLLRTLNNKLSQYVINNWKRDAKFINSRELVLITGGSSGLGELLAMDLAERGVKVVILDINPPKNPHPGVHFYNADITSSKQLATVAKEIRQAHGDPTVLINNAGIFNTAPILDQPESSIRKTFEVNTLSHFLTVKEFLPAMVKKNHGHIVSVASMASYVTIAGLTDYACTKASVVAFHEGLATELKYRYNAPNVRTSLISPSWVRTPLIESLVSSESFKASLLDAKDVSSEIVKQTISGKSGHVILPWTYQLPTGIRAWPYWLQETVRNHFGFLVETR